jgi:hypothetical protein
LDSFFLFSWLVERLKVSLRLLQCGYSFEPAKEIPDSLSGFIHNFLGGERHDRWLNEPITPFSLFPPFALFLAPKIRTKKHNIVPAW